MAVQGQTDSGGANDGWGQWLTLLKSPKSNGEGWARVTDMLTKRDQQLESFEVQLMKRASLASFLIGAFIAGSREMPWAKQRFKEQHALSLFSSRAEVAGRLNNYMLITFWKVGGRVGVRMAAFAFSYTFVVACLARYRDRLKMSDFLIAGTVAGAVYRLPRGLRSSFAASIIGLAFSSISVLCMYPLVWMTNMSLDECYKNVREEHYRQELQRIKKERALREVMKKYNVSWWKAKAIWKAERETSAVDEEN